MAERSAKEQKAGEPLPWVSIIIPTYNGSRRIGVCLHALATQAEEIGAEILVVDDGSTDDTPAVLSGWPQVRTVHQPNAGPAKARNHGAREARGRIILFTDDDCEPVPGWLKTMLKPFEDPLVVGAKGAYRTRQRSVVARFVQAEYEDKYRYMQAFPQIDFIDTYSAAFRRDRFMEMGGYDTDFPVACAEDIELSYRMSARGWKMVFVPGALVYHQHPDRLVWYLRKKFKFAYWRMLAVEKNPGKGAKDTHTPQAMKLQLLLLPAVFCGLAADLLWHPRVPVTAVVVAGFLLSTVPFAARVARADLTLALLAPAMLAARAVAQFFGVLAGLVHVRRVGRAARVPTA